MQQLLLRAFTPRGQDPYHAPIFKEDFARTVAGTGLVRPSFFHYDDNGHHLPHGTPDIRFVSGRGWVGILSRSGDRNALEPVLGAVSRIVSDRYQRPIPIQIEALEFGLERTDYPVRYYVRDLALRYARAQTNPHKDMPNEELLRVALWRKLRFESGRNGFDLPTLSELEIQVFSPMRESAMPLRPAHGVTNKAVYLLNGEFAMNLRLKGMWQIGHFPSRGYGRLVPQINGVNA